MNIKVFQNGEYLIEEAEKSASQYPNPYSCVSLQYPKLHMDPDPDPEKKQLKQVVEDEDKCSENTDIPETKWNKCWTTFVQIPFKIFSYLEILIPLWLIHSQLLTDVLTEDWSKFKVDTSAFTFLWLFAILSYEWTKLSAILQLQCIKQKNKTRLSFLLGIKSLQIAVSSTLLLLSRLGVFISSDCGLSMNLTECKHCRILLVLLTVNILSFLAGHFFHSFSKAGEDKEEKEEKSKILWAGQFLQIYSHLEIWLSILVALAVAVNWENFCKFWNPTQISSVTIPVVYLCFLLLKFGVAIYQLRFWRRRCNGENGASLKGLIVCLGFHLLTFMLMLGFFIFCLVYWNDKSGYGPETAVPLTPSVQFGLLPMEIVVMTQIPCFLLGFLLIVQLRKLKKLGTCNPLAISI